MLLLLVALAILSASRRPPAPIDPLAIDAREVATASIDGVALAPGSPAFAAAAALPKRLVGLPPAERVSWVEPRLLRLGLRDGTTLWLQIMPDGIVRVTADGATSPRAERLRALRLRAFRLPVDSISPILGEVPGNAGISIGGTGINRVIHKNKERPTN